MRPLLLPILLAISLPLLAEVAHAQPRLERLPPPNLSAYPAAIEPALPEVAPAGGRWLFIPDGPPLPSEDLPPPHETLPAPAVTDFGHVTTIEADSAAMRLGPTVRVFEPKARVFFDTGWEAPDKLNLFHDGALSASINFLELYWQHQWPSHTPWSNLPLGHRDWRWGPAIGVGISPQAGDSSDGTQQSSGAPVLLLSAGLQFDFPLASSRDGSLRGLPTAGREFGYALGGSSDESLDYIADGAIYVGVAIHVLP